MIIISMQWRFYAVITISMVWIWLRHKTLLHLIYYFANSECIARYKQLCASIVERLRELPGYTNR